jgi:hypothetical protein
VCGRGLGSCMTGRIERGRPLAMEISRYLAHGGRGGASCLNKTLGQQLLGTRMQPAFVNIRYSYRVHVQACKADAESI